MMNERKNEMKVGDIVKSLDFVNIQDCYMIGKVVGISKMDGTFRAKTIARVWQGVPDKKFSDYFVAPLQGNHFADDLDLPRVFPRVEVLSEAWHLYDKVLNL